MLQAGDFGPSGVSASAPDGVPLTPQRERAPFGAHVLKRLVGEFQQLRLDSIVFATYRTACKLRHIQKRCLLHLIDLWNIIEAFRENGLNQLGAQQTVNAARVDALVAMLYAALQKRANLAELHLDEAAFAEARATLVGWLVRAFDADTNGTGHVRVFVLKCVLSTLSAGRFVDKLKYHFTLVSDQNCSAVVKDKLEMYVQSLCSMPAAVFEGHNFPYSPKLIDALLRNRNNIDLPHFVETMLNESTEAAAVAYFPWLLALAKIGSVECVTHACKCDGCQQQNFVGFRYRCRKCHSYNLCQRCFWTGVALHRHPRDHPFREYTYSRCPSASPAQFDQSNPAARSIRVPSSATGTPVRQPFAGTLTSPNSAASSPFKVIPVSQAQNGNTSTFSGNYGRETPVSRRTFEPDVRNERGATLDAASASASAANQSAKMNANAAPNQQRMQQAFMRSHTTTSVNWKVDDDHRLIAQYVARLQQRDAHASASDVQQDLSDNLSARIANQRESIRRLESNNRELMLEIQRLQHAEREQLRSLREAQEAQLRNNVNGPLNERSPVGVPLSQSMPTSMLSVDANGNSDGCEVQLYTELKQLRAHKDELESRMTQLKDSRRDLIVQLETLMRLLKTCTNTHGQASLPSRAYTQSPLTVAHPPYVANVAFGRQRAASATRAVTSGDVTPIRNLETPPIVRERGGGPSQFSFPTYQSLPSHTSISNGQLANRPASATGFNSTASLDVQIGANSGASSARNLHSDLLLAADSVTNAITSLVRELNSEAEGSSDDESRAATDRESEVRNGATNRTTSQPNASSRTNTTQFEYALERALENEEVASKSSTNVSQQPSMRAANVQGSGSGSGSGKQLTAARRSNPVASSARFSSRAASASCTDDESCLETDVESYIRTDDEEGGNSTDFEDSMMRWVNR